MKKVTAVLASGLLTIAVSAHAASSMTQQQKMSYTLGAGLGSNLQSQAIKLDLTTFQQGLSDAYQKKRLQLTPDEMDTQIKQFRNQQVSKYKEAKKALAGQSKQASRAFLAANKSKPGVKELSDGLQYKVIKAGMGKKPNKDSIVTVNYEGKLIDGKVFDSSYRRGKPAIFPVNAVIKGWQQAIPMMKTGATWMLYVPSDLAYGKRGVPGVIPSGSALIFKVHLISFQK